MPHNLDRRWIISRSLKGLSPYGPIRVSCFCTEAYDGLDFAGYPLRKGWRQTSSGPLELRGRSLASQAAFFQTWLFFGVLKEVLGHSFAEQDFVRDGYVATAKLPIYTRDWYNRWQTLSDVDRKSAYLTVQRCLVEAKSNCVLLLGDKTSDCSLPREVDVSIRILGESLSHAFYHICESLSIERFTRQRDIRGKWGHSELLVVEMLGRNWCPSDVAFLQHYPPASSNSGMYYANYLERSSSENHERCSRNACTLRQFDSRSYVQKHCTALPIGCNGHCKSISPPQDIVCSILDRGGIPLLKACISDSSTDGHEISLDVVEHEEGMKYTAISHVWCDGYGNPESNAILSCQAKFLYRSLPGVRYHGPQPGTSIYEALFWIDTLLVPTGHGKSKSKNFALERMYDAYRNASNVLVVEASLYNKQPSEGLEAAIELLCSKWMRRLWTLQEGVLGAERLYVLFRNGPWHLWKGLLQFHEEQYSNPWLINPVYQFAARLGLFNLVQAKGDRKMSWFYRDMAWRSTSQPSDEGLVFAALSGLSPSALLQVPPVERMKTAVSMPNGWPSRVIFAPGPRFVEEGYRWALRSFLSPSNFTLTGAIVRPNFSSKSGPLGIPVKYSGYLIEKRTVDFDLNEFLLFDPEANKWLRARKPREPLYSHTAEDFGPSEHLISSGRPIALLLHEPPWLSRHAFGALLSLDHTNLQDYPHGTLSGTHEGVFDVFVLDVDSSEKFKLNNAFQEGNMVNEQLWVVR
ncbi:het domain protein [Seiridium cupressi]